MKKPLLLLPLLTACATSVDERVAPVPLPAAPVRAFDNGRWFDGERQRSVRRAGLHR